MKHKKWICLSAALLLLILLVIGLLHLCRKDQLSAPNTGGIVLDASQEAWEGSLEAPQESGIRIPGYGTIYFPAGEREVSLTLYNPKENSCYFTFSLYLGEEETPLYTSDYVEPGNAIREVTLSRGLEPGEYTMYIVIGTCDPETQATMNGASVKTTLVVV